MTEQPFNPCGHTAPAVGAALICARPAGHEGAHAQPSGLDQPTQWADIVAHPQYKIGYEQGRVEMRAALADEVGQREQAEEWADRLATRIADVTGANIGEHSSENNPWRRALEALDGSRP